MIRPTPLTPPYILLSPYYRLLISHFVSAQLACEVRSKCNILVSSGTDRIAWFYSEGSAPYMAVTAGLYRTRVGEESFYFCPHRKLGHTWSLCLARGHGALYRKGWRTDSMAEKIYFIILNGARTQRRPKDYFSSNFVIQVND